MGKGWSILFAVVFLGCFGSFAIAPIMKGWWLPANVSSFGGDVDNLFYVILALTGFFFVLTEVILIYNMWRYAHVEGRKSDYTHGNHRLEMLWTIVPAAILLFIAFAQIQAWEKIKYQAQMPGADGKAKVNVVVQVTARQWEWRIRQPAVENIVPKNLRDWAEFPQADDVHLVNELHTWKGANTKIYLKTQDVIHSFFLPNLRLKQDALPGKTIPMWFNPTEANYFRDSAKGTWEVHPTASGATCEIACAELCGGRHYAMRGQLYVHVDEADYKAWLKQALEKQQSYKPEAATVAANQE